MDGVDSSPPGSHSPESSEYRLICSTRDRWSFAAVIAAVDLGADRLVVNDPGGGKARSAHDGGAGGSPDAGLAVASR